MRDTIYRQDAIEALRLEYPAMPMFKSLREEWAIKTEGFRKAEEVIMQLPSADRPQGICEYGKYCMCATCSFQNDCSNCADCMSNNKQMHDIWSCTKYMRKEQLRKGADNETAND